MQITDSINATARRVPKWGLYLIGVIPFALLVVNLLTGNLGVDPAKALEHELGKLGLQFLLAGLLVTPLRRFAGLNFIKFRRVLGLLAFFYITMHLLVWLTMDIQLLWGQIWADILKRPYITIGMAGFALMIPLALTSNDTSLRRLGALAWRRLHRLTYVVVILGAVHYVMVVKGWQLQPFVYLGLALALIALRAVPGNLAGRLRSSTAG